MTNQPLPDEELDKNKYKLEKALYDLVYRGYELGREDREPVNVLIVRSREFHRDRKLKMAINNATEALAAALQAYTNRAVLSVLERVEREVITAQDKKEYWPVWRKELIAEQRTSLSKIRDSLGTNPGRLLQEDACGCRYIDGKPVKICKGHREGWTG